MTGSQNQPRDFDAIRGGDAPPLLGAVLGGVEGVKQRLTSSDVETRVAALGRALNYGDAGLNLVIKALDDNSAKVRKAAVRLLKDIDNSQVKAALKEYKFWTTFEKYYDIPNNHATTFANRKVIEFDPDIGITDTFNTAYAFRSVPADYFTKSVMSSVDKLHIVSQSPLANQVEALVFGFWYTSSLKDYTFNPVLDVLLKNNEKFSNVKALFLGDINNEPILPLAYCNLSYILLAYSQLETLKIRNNCTRYSYPSYAVGLEFSPILHEKLKTLIIEGSNIVYDVFEEICNLELPALEYLELWMGENQLISGYSISEFISIFYNIFPKLKYLGLRNYDHEYPDNIAFAIANSPICENLVELDISIGKMADEGANALFECAAVRQLDTLNISHNCLSDEMVKKLNQLDIKVISEMQKPYRYWSTYE